ncbi:tRNA threonylcarbamoyladenosine dehydratase ASCRUDRAFT_30476 [Ascoidea rubescens DSM 1968]|uniref:THIF-type NAD/FAD binding fold domain-containing protein n=1 Tax=Ascoidea rubescens DSM 1968 TaxID=1344418 RepID=A0A1D2VQJ4_9ASCO|nr:hypothetical protein ASCRUDRAFT_30476 [Ascoidea rubescens DSM 1968]ODV63882.1 hypothetical protein ASCRUDRAFT_30476 [Ascoidea rubescens DSM 1968]
MMSSSFKVIGLTALVSAIVTGGLVEVVGRYLRNNGNRSADEDTTALQKKENLFGGEYDEDLIREQLARNYVFLGEEGVNKLRKDTFIVVVGVGGVGSWVTTMMVRSGISKIRIIDFDQVTLSSLNRHAVATLSDVGVSKVLTLKKHLLKVAPWCEIETINELWNLETSERLLEGSPTFVVDCIDNIDTKVDLLEYCHKKKINVISSMGAGCKSDPTTVNIGDISNTGEDPLARSVRRRLKKRGIASGITVVFSAEKPDPRKASLLPLPEDEYMKGNVDELTPLRDFRVRILPVLGPMPGIFGLTITSYLLTYLTGYPLEPIEGVTKNRAKTYEGILHTLAAQQSRLGGQEQRVPLSLNDVVYVVDEIFRAKSAISSYSTRLALSRWDMAKEISPQNLVLMTREEQLQHEQRVLSGRETPEDVYPPEVLQRVQNRFEEERYYARFR